MTETITAEFTGSWNGIYRSVPVEYRTPQGFNWTLRLDLLGVTDQSGTPLEVESGRERHYVKYKIWVPGAENATRTVVLRYRAKNGLRFFEDHDELYWNVTGDEWDVPIEAATARIELPAAATGVRAIAFNGVYGSTARDADRRDPGHDQSASRCRKPLELPRGAHRGGRLEQGCSSPSRPGRTGRSASSRATGPSRSRSRSSSACSRSGAGSAATPRGCRSRCSTSRPTSLTPAEAGTLMDYSADMRDITATVVDLAVRGHLRIEERDETRAARAGQAAGIRVPPAGARRGSAAALQPHERRILDGIFDGATAEVELSDLENEFYRHLPGIKDSIFDRLVEPGLYRSRPDQVQGAAGASAPSCSAWPSSALGAVLGARSSASRRCRSSSPRWRAASS